MWLYYQFVLFIQTIWGFSSQHLSQSVKIKVGSAIRLNSFLFDESFWCEAFCPTAILLSQRPLRWTWFSWSTSVVGSLSKWMDSTASMANCIKTSSARSCCSSGLQKQLSSLCCRCFVHVFMSVGWNIFGCSTVLTLKGETSFPKPSRKWGGSD